MRIIIGAFAVLLIFVLGVTVLRPPRVCGVVAFSSRFVGYTNDAAGTRLAVFQISNTSPQCVEWDHGYEIQRRDEFGWSQGPPVLFTNVCYAHGPLLHGFESQTVRVSVPSAPERWRLCISYIQYESSSQQFSRAMRRGLQKLGFSTAVPTRLWHEFHSEEMAP